jgi:hypothetical protein
MAERHHKVDWTGRYMCLPGLGRSMGHWSRFLAIISSARVVVEAGSPAWPPRRVGWHYSPMRSTRQLVITFSEERGFSVPRSEPNRPSNPRIDRSQVGHLQPLHIAHAQESGDHF